VQQPTSYRAYKHVKPDTVLHWLDLAGQQCAAASDHLICNLHRTQAQVDELWTIDIRDLEVDTFL
jgi:hypothetical protein